jgi:hypothetical protein
MFFYALSPLCWIVAGIVKIYECLIINNGYILPTTLVCYFKKLNKTPNEVKENP